MMISIATLVHFQDKQTEDTNLNYQSTTSHKTISCQDLISLFQEITQTMALETTHICKNILMTNSSTSPMILTAISVLFQDRPTLVTNQCFQLIISHKTTSCQDHTSQFQEITQTMVSEITHICKNILMISLTVIQLITKISMTKVSTWMVTLTEDMDLQHQKTSSIETIFYQDLTTQFQEMSNIKV